ncbi:putative aminohydrolase SsnA [Eubacterium sp.]|uniref:putative aminohydrolase SsnA n=1 Tax=Eubacterium sp. TaxID=142586 RepID=UPI002FC98242
MILIGNGRMITRAEATPFLEDGCVAVDGKTIAAVGTTAEMKKAYPDAQFIDARGGVIMPGLINAHNHIYSTFARGLSIDGHNPKNFMDILDGLWWTLDRNLNNDANKYSAYATYIDCIKQGVTTIFDHHASYGQTEGSLFAIADVAKELGLRTSLCYEVSDRDGEEKMKAAVKENVDFIKAAQSDTSGMVHGMFGLHAAFTLSDETLDYCNAEKPEGAGYHVHVAEGLDDVYDSLKKYNKRVVNRLFDKNILGPNTLAIHCIHINGEEMEILKATDTMVVHNPESNMGNAVGCPPVLELMRRGLTLGLGTDGYTNDMIESYKVANILHKHYNCDPNVAWGEIPTMLFGNNAIIAERAFGKKLGVLEAGAAADVIVTDYIPTTPMNADNANSHILFGMCGRSTVTTMCNGKVLMQDRVLQGIDEEAVLAKGREEAQKLANRINKR